MSHPTLPSWTVAAIALLVPLQVSAQEKPDHRSWDADTLAIEHAQIVLPPPSSGMAAGYLTIFNGTDRQVALASVTTPAFGEVSLHNTETEDGVVRMRSAIGSVRIPQSSELVMHPGGFHLMLMEPQGKLYPNQWVTLEVAFRDGSTRSIEADLLAFGERPVDHHHGEEEAADR